MDKKNSAVKDAIDFLPDAQALELRRNPVAIGWVLYLLLGLVVFFILWATFSQMDKLIIGRGQLVTPLPNIVVQPLETAVLKSIQVRVGQVVRKGDVLAMLDSTFIQADAGQLGVRDRTLTAQVDRLRAELSGNGLPSKAGTGAKQDINRQLFQERQANYDARMRQLSENVQRLRASLDTTSLDQVSLRNRVAALAEMEEMHASLAEKQFSSRSRILEVKERRLEVERDLNLANNRENEIHREIAAAEAERSAFANAWRQRTLEELIGAQRDRDEVGQQLSKTSRRGELVTLSAPEDSIVLEIGPKSVGAVVKEAEPLFTLVPIDTVLEAEVEIAPADIALLKAGQRVRIKIDAYPFQKHGIADGVIKSISPDVLLRQGAGPKSANSYYLARIGLEKTELKYLPAGPTRLLPGMTVAGEVVVGQRSVISYFLYPLVRGLDESLREP